MKTISHEKIYAAKVFEVENIHFENQKHPYTRLLSPDWVNVLAVTSEKKAIMIRQFRVGTLTDTLEVPGGCVDANEKDTTMAALRELEEETGFTSARILPLGSLAANPALMNNKLHMFLAMNCVLNPDRQHFPDESENIKVELVPLEELEQLVRLGRVDHCLSALTIMMAKKYFS